MHTESQRHTGNSMDDIFRQLGLTRLINVSGTETERGGTPVREEVIAAVAELVKHSVNMIELQSAASHIIAEAFETEAGCVTGCTAGSVAIAVAAAMTGANLARAEQLPDTTGMKSDVVMQLGHEVTYGQIVSQNIRLAGARIVGIGTATECATYQLENAITPNTAAAFYVVSHLTTRDKLIDLSTFCRVCKEMDVPVIVDAASQGDPQTYLACGADLVLFSTQKAFGGLTGGVIAGRRDLVKACIYQGQGIGRPMKPGKEAVISAIAAIRAWMKTDREQQSAAIKRRVDAAAAELNAMPGIDAVAKGTQVIITVREDETQVNAFGLARQLENGSPSIVIWDHFAAHGELRMSLKLVSDEVSRQVCEAIRLALQAPDAKKLPFVSPGDRLVAQLDRWPIDLKERS
jgi:D-glucosaminate-6-phosphate ammonia-lyase